MTTSHHTLVAYFSATGTTKAAAQQLAQAAQADLFEIAPEVPYTAADLNWNDKNSRSSVEMRDRNSRPAMAQQPTDLAQYDTIYLGFPIWWYVAPTIINTFIEANNLANKRIVVFATSGGSALKPTFRHLVETYPQLEWVEGELLNHASAATAQALVDKVK